MTNTNDRKPIMQLNDELGEMLGQPSFAEKKRTLCPTVNCTEPRCDYKHD